MKIFSKSILCLGILATAALSAGAFELISPSESEVTKVTDLGPVTLKWSAEFPEDDELDYSKQLLLLNSEGTQISTASFDFDWNNGDFAALAAEFVPVITDPGTYTVVVPANVSKLSDNREYRLPFEIEANTSTPAEPTEITPAPGSTIVQDEATYTQFNQIRLDFANDKSISLNENLITLKDENGKSVEYSITGFYRDGDPMLAYVDYPFVNFDFNLDGNMPSGTYTFNAKPGAFSSPRGMYEQEITLTYYYTKTKADADDSDLVIESALMGGVTSTSTPGTTPVYNWVGDNAETVTPDMPLGQLKGIVTNDEGTGFLVTFNHGEKSNYVTCELLDLTTNESLTFVEPQKQQDGSFLVAFAMDINLYQGTTYALEFHTYDNVQNKTEFGSGARLTLAGTTEGYKYSSAKFVTSVPVDGATITTLDNTKVTVLFTEPVAATAQFNLGMGASEPLTIYPANEGQEYDNVWYFEIPQVAINGYPACDVAITAFGVDGNIVAGNNGTEDNSKNYLSYFLTFYQPRVMLTQTNNHVPEINTFVAYSSKNNNGINTSWLAYPYVIDDKGNTVATINQEYYNDPEFGLRPYKELSWTSGSEPSPLELEFQMIPPVTKKGKYTLVIPEGSFFFGTQFDSDTSVPQSYDFYVVDFYPVNYSVDNSTIAIGSVETGKTATVALTPAEGWKLESLTLNGDDVTANVVNGDYTTPAATGEMNLVAQYTFDGVVVTPAGIDDVVTDLNLRGWSQDGKLIIAGLKEGQIVNVYTVGGSLMATANVGEQDMLEIAVPAGVYVITVREANQQVALKLVNK